MNSYGGFVSFLSSEFQRYLLEHQEEAEQVPSNALIVFDVAGEPEFSRWHRDVSLKNRESGQPIIHVRVGRLRRHAAIEEVKLGAISA